MSDDEATIIMVDSNIQREELLPSEKAFAFKMRMDAMRHQGATCGHDVQKLTQQVVGEASGFSGRQVTRYIRLTELIPELLDMVDAKRITFVAGVEISYIDQSVQKWLCEYIHDNGVIKPEQIAALRKRLESGMINQSQMIMVLNDNLKGRLPSRRVALSEKKLNKYFLRLILQRIWKVSLSRFWRDGNKAMGVSKNEFQLLLWQSGRPIQFHKNPKGTSC